MLETDYRDEMTARLSRCECRVEVPRSLEHRLSAQGPSRGPRNEKRRFSRHAMPQKALLEVRTTFKGLERRHAFFAVLTTDVSRDGVAFLHDQQLFPGEIPFLWLRTGKMACCVVRCLRHNARCFEIGTVFEAGTQSREWLRRASHPGDVAGNSSPIWTA